MQLYDKIKSHFSLPTAYEDWKEYRQSLTNYLITQTNQVTLPLCFYANTDMDSILPTLAIIGAGVCNDIDLKAILPHFSKITLIDYDNQAMQTALTTYHITDCDKITCIPLSLNGINDYHYQDFCTQLQYYIQCYSGNFTPDEFENFAISKVREYFDSTKDYQIPLENNTYDYICCFGVHSQLQAMFSYIYKVFETNLRNMYFQDTKDFNGNFSQCLRDENTRFIPLLNDALLNCAKQAVFLGLELQRTSSEGAIEGAYQAFEDITRRHVETLEEPMLWPFLPASNIQYEMSLLKISV